MNTRKESNTYDKNFKKLVDEMYMEAIFDLMENRAYQIIDGEKYKLKL